MFKCVLFCSNVFYFVKMYKCVQTCKNLFSHVQMGSDMTINLKSELVTNGIP